jgi:hypothetical protein
VARDQNPNEILEDESSRLESALESCRHLIANYRSMLNDSSNDNALDEAASEASERQQAEL